MFQKHALIPTAIITAVVLITVFGFSTPNTIQNDKKVTITPVGKIITETELLTKNQIPIKLEESVFGFEGYAIGKGHIGSFENTEIHIIKENESIIGLTATIQTSSINTGLASLDRHLKNEDFLEVVTYPEIYFIATNINKEQSQMTGRLTLKGITKEITFPVKLEENRISSEFFLDTTAFNINYAGVDKNVRIFFDIKY